MANKQGNARVELESTLGSTTRIVPSVEDVESMDVLSVLHVLCKDEGLPLVGDVERAFAHYDSERQVINVYARTADAVCVWTDAHALLDAFLDIAKAEGATFKVAHDRVICTMNGFSAWGHTPGEAAMRAHAKCQLSSCSTAAHPDR